MKKFLLSLIIAVTLAAVACAEDISVKATVSSDHVTLGSGLQYTITVFGAQGMEPPDISGIDGFDVRYSGPSTSVSVVNGAYSVKQGFNYVLIPLKEGKFTIPAVTVPVKGQSFTTAPVVVDVLAANASAVVPSGADPHEKSASGDIESRLKLLVSVPSGNVFVGEPVPLTIRLYVNQLSLQDLVYPEITQEGFQIDAFAEPKQMQDTLNGVNWNIVEFKTNLYPSRTGELVIAPIVLRGNIVFKVNAQRDSSGGLFDEGFFSNFFTNYQKRPVTITSRIVKLQVQSLPEDGKPADFSGAVGRYDLAVEASPLKVKAGDPITLRMVLTGAGNIKAVKLPSIQSSGFKVYDPQVKDEPGRKILEQVIMPTDPKLTQIPAVRFSFFDTATGSYKTLERGPFAIEVAPPVAGEEFQAVGFALPTALSVPETLGRDIIFIKDNPGKLVKSTGLVQRNLPFYLALVVYLNIWAALFVVYFYRRRLIRDPGFARQLAALRQADVMFRTADACLKSSDVKGFYDVLEKGLSDYFVRRLALAPGQTDIANLVSVLFQLKIDEKYRSNLQDIYAAAERVRFAGILVLEGQMRNHLADAQDIVKVVERRSR